MADQQVREAADPQAADPQAADPQAADPQAADPQAADPQAADPQAADPQVADPQAEAPENSNDGTEQNIDIEMETELIEAVDSLSMEEKREKAVKFTREVIATELQAFKDAIVGRKIVTEDELNLEGMDADAKKAYLASISIHPIVDIERILPNGQREVNVYGRQQFYMLKNEEGNQQ